MSNDLPRPTLNRLLSKLSADEFGLLSPHLKPVDLPLRKSLEVHKKPIDQVYFLESGFASVVANGPNQGIEIGLVGREGMTGLAVVMGTDRTPHDTYMQSAGAGWRIGAAHLRRAMEQSATLHRAMLLYAHTFAIQTSFTAVANGRSKIEERLARWLLMAHDRIERDQLTLTHEFLAIMLGVRRPGVSVALKLIEQSGVIRVTRGAIHIVDRKRLEQMSNGVYGTAEDEFQRLFG